MKSTMVILGLSLLMAVSLRAQEPDPADVQFQVNSYTTGYQGDSAVAADALGNFVVVWTSNGSSGTDTWTQSIHAQRLEATGDTIGGEFQVNSYTRGIQWKPSVAADADGNFVVVWQGWGSYGTDRSAWSVQAQLFDTNGTPIGGEFQVNTYTTNHQYEAAVAADAEGNFVVVWRSNGSYGTDTSDHSIQAQLFDTNGAPIGGEFQVNSYTSGWQVSPAVAADAEGNFVVVWKSDGSYGTDSHSIQAQLFDANGAPIGGQFQVNTYTTGVQHEAVVATDAQGNFVVVWRSDGSYGTDTSGNSIQGQRFDAAGSPISGQFQVNSYTTLGQVSPAVAADADGNFVVVWQSYRSNGTDRSASSIQAQLYDATGAAVARQFQVNSYTTGGQAAPAVAEDAQGNFVVVWESDGSYGTDTSGNSIQGQRDSFLTAIVFPDGFESGDTSAWSSTVP